MALAMAEAAPTVAAVRCKSFGRAKIVEALELFGVSAHPRTGARALKAKLVELGPRQRHNLRTGTAAHELAA